MVEAIAIAGAVLAILLLGRRVTLARIRSQERRYVSRGIGQLERWLHERVAPGGSK